MSRTLLFLACCAVVPALASTNRLHGFDGSKPSRQDAEKESPVKLSVVDLDDGDEFLAKSERVLQLKIEGQHPERLPKRYKAAFIRRFDKAIAGSFLGDLEKSTDSPPRYSSNLKVKVPSRPGDYTLKITAVPVRAKEATPEEKASKEYKIKVKE